VFPGIQRPLQPLSKGAQKLLELVADIGVDHMIMVFQKCRIQKLWVHGDFRPDFKGRPGSLHDVLHG
jgi:hypothetical protein